MTILALLLLVAIGGLSGAVLSSLRLARTTEESARADEAARSLVARMQLETFDEIFRRYDAAPLDDPEGENTAPGASFDVPGLTPRADDPDGRVGRIVFPSIDLPGELQALDETVEDLRLGMPEGGRDLNGDGDATDQLTSGYVLLPVRVIVEWSGAGGERTYELDVQLVNL